MQKKEGAEMPLYRDRERYGAYVKKRASRSRVLQNAVNAGVSGGAICAFGQSLFYLYRFFEIPYEMASIGVTVTLIFVAALLSGLGIFDRIARFAGAGTLVPVTGFANAVASPAIDTKSEGWVLGVGAKIFTVAGPVILYGTLTGTLYGVIYYVVRWLF